MCAQNYSAVDAHRRWLNSDLGSELRIIRRNYLRHRLSISLSPVERSCFPLMSRFAKWRTLVFGRVTWGVFARAYWAIYQPGVSPAFYGSVLFSEDPADHNSPALFEIAEYSRKVMEFDVPLDGIEHYANVIRDDHSMPGRLEVPVPLATKPGVFLQSIAIERARLPCEYLHHRLVPIVTSRSAHFAAIIHHQHWSPEFRGLWCAGDPPLSEMDLADYSTESPEITP